jgi:hypothetical protein
VAEPSGFMTDLSQSAYLSLSIKRAISAAQQRSHRYVTLEHLVLAMLDDPGAMEILEGLRADIPSIRREITETVNRNLATLYAPGEGDQRASYKVERVLGTASDDASRLGCDEVDAAFVIAAMSRETDSPAAEVLKRNGVSYTNAVTWLYTNRGASFGGRTQRARPQPAPAAPAPVAPPPLSPSAPASPAPSAAPPPTPAPSVAPAAPAPQPAPRSMADALAKVREEAETKTSSGAAEDFEEDEVDDLDLDLEEDSDHAPARGDSGAVAMGRTPRAPERTPAPVQPAPRLQPVPAGPRRTERIETRPVPAAAAPAPVNPAPRHADPEPVNRGTPGPGQRRGETQVPPSSRLDEMRVRPGGAPAKPRPAPPPPQPQPAASSPPAPPAPSPSAAPGAAARTRSRSGETPALEQPPRETAAAASEAAPAPRPGRRKPRAQHPLVGRLIENIPRRMRAGVADRIEVRISREDTQKLMRGMEGRGEPVRHDIALTQTMSVALRAPDGGFTIEPMSPETQWIFERPDNAETYGRWRWVVTPHSSGERRLQLLVASRSIGANGLMGDSALPDQIITVRVRINYWRALGRGLQWLLALVVGGVLTEAVLLGLKLFGKQ